MTDWVDPSTRVTLFIKEHSITGWYQYQNFADLLRREILPLKASDVLFRYKFAALNPDGKSRIELSVNVAPNNQRDHVITILESNGIPRSGIEPKEPHEPYGVQIARDCLGYTSYDYSQMGEEYNKTWESDYHCAKAIVESDVWKYSDPLGADKKDWTDAFRTTITSNHFADWNSPTTCEEKALQCQRLHYLCNMLLLTVDWFHLVRRLGFSSTKTLSDKLNTAQHDVLQKPLPLPQAFEQTIGDWIKLLP